MVEHDEEEDDDDRQRQPSQCLSDAGEYHVGVAGRNQVGVAFTHALACCPSRGETPDSLCHLVASRHIVVPHSIPCHGTPVVQPFSLCHSQLGKDRATEDECRDEQVHEQGTFIYTVFPEPPSSNPSHKPKEGEEEWSGDFSIKENDERSGADGEFNKVLTCHGIHEHKGGDDHQGWSQVAEFEIHEDENQETCRH